MDIIACSTFAIIILLISVSCGTFYKYFVKSDESTLLTAVAFILSLSTSFILVLFIPIDIYLVSNGNLEISNLEINQKLISKFYHFMFWVLIFEAYVVVPFSYFYLKNKSKNKSKNEGINECKNESRNKHSYKNEFDDNIMPCENAIESLKKTEKGKEMEYISDLLDMNHTGQSAILFLMGCIVLVGVSFWATYTSYGIACLPLSFLQQKNIEYDRIELENRFTNLKEKEMMIKYKYNTYNEIRGNDKYEMEKIEKMKRVLSKYNYKLQEIEKSSESWVSYVTGIGLTFRVITGLIFLTFSFIIYISLLASITDKYFNSICAYKCGFVLEQINTIFNLLDTLLIFFSRVCAEYAKGKRNASSSLLFNYSYYSCSDNDIINNCTELHYLRNSENKDRRYIKCSLKTDKNVCKMSVLSVFFNKIFFVMYTFAFVYRIFFKKISYLDNIDEQDFNKEDLDENINLLPLETLT
ncbi:LMBR1 domain-containing protein [Plasmodium brasilianum]|uniref:LMBR1 domain-containing protein n=1 Tax=Plasmodium brasilianum TaxID=5824 RepID=A0ACB9Y459_PLABR|nr:LMBR1 domain-containing protein [Plasmodium brasilianum]